MTTLPAGNRDQCCFLLLLLSLVGCSSQRAQGSVAGAADVVVETSSEGDQIADGGEDGETTEAEDSIPEQDALPDVVGQGDADVSVGGDTLQDVALSPVCAAVDLPEPGQTCDQEGAVRCSNVGAVVNNIATYAGIGCYRPNVMLCASTDAGLRWKQESCESMTGVKSGGPTGSHCAQSVSCVIRSESDHGCQPTAILGLELKANPAAQQTSNLSKGHAFGGEWCSPGSVSDSV